MSHSLLNGKHLNRTRSSTSRAKNKDNDPEITKGATKAVSKLAPALAIMSTPNDPLNT